MVQGRSVLLKQTFLQNSSFRLSLNKRRDATFMKYQKQRINFFSSQVRHSSNEKCYSMAFSKFSTSEGETKKNDELTLRVPVGIAFDIDGVLIRGNVVIPGAKKALEFCKENSIPFVFITNGGGVNEEAKSCKLSKILDFPITGDQVQLSHTPMRELATLYHDRPVLVIGDTESMQVCHSYGFKKVFNSQMLAALWPEMDPWKRFLDYPVDDKTRNMLKEIGKGRNVLPTPDAVIMIHDPIDWHIEIMVLTEVLMPKIFEKQFGKNLVQSEGSFLCERENDMHLSMQESLKLFKNTISCDNTCSNGNENSWGDQIPFYVSHTDLLGTFEYPYPVVIAGGFLVALTSVFKAVHGKNLKMVKYGKPYPVVYSFAHQLMKKEALKIIMGEEGIYTAMSNSTPKVQFDTLYIIGDNPLTDIKGAREAGAPWKSVLVKTGIFQPLSDKENDTDNPADAVREDVFDAVQWIIQKHVRTIRSSRSCYT